MNKEQIKTYINTLFSGTLIGLLVPFVTIYLFFLITPTEKSFGNFIQYSLLFKVFTRLLSLCAIPNLGLFFLFMKLEYLKAARGIILATFIITFGVLLIKGFSI